VNRFLDFLLSDLYDHDGRDLHPPHRDDLQKSGITPATIVQQKIRSPITAFAETLKSISGLASECEPA
jgi:hypothetical protein